jgi:hypothetical protein
MVQFFPAGQRQGRPTNSYALTLMFFIVISLQPEFTPAAVELLQA